MRWSKVARILSAKPYLIDPLRCRGSRAAKELLQAQGMPTPVAVWERARAQAGMSIPEWEQHTGMPLHVVKRMHRKAAPVEIGRRVTLPRRVALVGGVLLVLTALLACTPTGRALATQIYNAVCSVVDDLLYIGMKPHTDESIEVEAFPSAERTIRSLDSIGQAMAQIDHPLLYFAGGELEVSYITHSSSEMYGERLETLYTGAGAIQVIIAQEWDVETALQIVMDGATEQLHIRLDNGIVVDGVYAEYDGSFSGAIVDTTTAAAIFISGLDGSDAVKEILSFLEMSG